MRRATARPNRTAWLDAVDRRGFLVVPGGPRIGLDAAASRFFQGRRRAQGQLGRLGRLRQRLSGAVHFRAGKKSRQGLGGRLFRHFAGSRLLQRSPWRRPTTRNHTRRVFGGRGRRGTLGARGNGNAGRTAFQFQLLKLDFRGRRRRRRRRGRCTRAAQRLQLQGRGQRARVLSGPQRYRPRSRSELPGGLRRFIWHTIGHP